MRTAVLPRVATRPAVAGDERLMRSLFADTREDFFLLDTDVRNALLGMQYRARRVQIAESAPDARRSVLLVDGVPVGCLEISSGADGVRVLDLIVAWDQRDRGVAASVLLDLMAQNRSIAVDIPVTDDRFAALLQRLGFHATGSSCGRAFYRYQR